MLLSKRRWTRCTLWTHFSEPPTRRKVRKKALKTFTQLRKNAQRSKIKKKTQTFLVVVHVAVIASKKARTPTSSTLAAGFSIAGAHPALCFLPPPFTVVKETGQPVLPVYTSQNQAKKAHWWCCEPCPSTCVQPDVLQHTALHHLQVDLRKPQGW